MGRERRYPHYRSKVALMKQVIMGALLFWVASSLCAQNIFVGQWQTDTGNYYRFSIDGTGVIAESPDGNGIENFSFLTWEGTGITTGYPKLNTLLLATGAGTSPSDITLKLYTYTPEGGDTIRVEDGGGNELVLTRIAGTPAPLNVRPHLLMGQWEAKWNGGNHDGALGTWSFLYRPDGTVKAYHHRLHQFENAYLVRGALLVIIGEWRFHPAFPVNIGVISEKGKNGVFVREAGGTTFDYKRKNKVAWK